MVYQHELIAKNTTANLLAFDASVVCNFFVTGPRLTMSSVTLTAC